MKKTLTALAVLAMLPAGAALADDDCFVPMADWQPREAVANMAHQNNWTVRRIKIDDGCYEIKGRDASGREIEVTVHPATLQVIEFEYEDDDDDDDHRPRRFWERGRPNLWERGQADPAPTGPITPPANGLFGNGAPPVVQTK
jgi:hypothetical protein